MRSLLLLPLLALGSCTDTAAEPEAQAGRFVAINPAETGLPAGSILDTASGALYISPADADLSSRTRWQMVHVPLVDVDD